MKRHSLGTSDDERERQRQWSVWHFIQVDFYSRQSMPFPFYSKQFQEREMSTTKALFDPQLSGLLFTFCFLSLFLFLVKSLLHLILFQSLSVSISNSKWSHSSFSFYFYFPLLPSMVHTAFNSVPVRCCSSITSLTALDHRQVSIQDRGNRNMGTTPASRNSRGSPIDIRHKG